MLESMPAGEFVIITYPFVFSGEGAGTGTQNSYREMVHRTCGFRAHRRDKSCIIDQVACVVLHPGSLYLPSWLSDLTVHFFRMFTHQVPPDVIQGVGTNKVL